MGAKRKVTVDIEDVHQYLMYWYDSETFRDFNIMMDEGQTDLAAYHIWSSGALDGSDPCPARDEAIRLAKRFDKLSRKSQDKVYDETFKDARIHECADCNSHEFVDRWNRDLYPDKEFETCGQCQSKAVVHTDWNERVK